MTYNEAGAMWPQLRTGAVAAPTTVAQERLAFRRRPDDGKGGEGPVAPSLGDSQVTAGIVYSIRTNLLDRPTMCQLRFAQPVADVTREGLVSFICMVRVDDSTMLGVVSDRLFATWQRQFGTPTGRVRGREALSETAADRWESKVVYVEYSRQLNALRLVGQTLQWQTSLETIAHPHPPK